MAETTEDKSGVSRQGASDVPEKEDRASAGDRLGPEQSSTSGAHDNESERAQTTAPTGAIHSGGDEENGSELDSSEDDDDDDDDDGGYRSRGPPKRPVNNGGTVVYVEKPKGK